MEAETVIEMMEKAEKDLLFISSVADLINAAENSCIEIVDYLPVIQEVHERAFNVYWKIDEILNALKEQENE